MPFLIKIVLIDQADKVILEGRFDIIPIADAGIVVHHGKYYTFDARNSESNKAVYIEQNPPLDITGRIT